MSKEDAEINSPYELTVKAGVSMRADLLQFAREQAQKLNQPLSRWFSDLVEREMYKRNIHPDSRIARKAVVDEKIFHDLASIAYHISPNMAAGLIKEMINEHYDPNNKIN